MVRALLVILIVFGAAGCGDDDDDDPAAVECPGGTAGLDGPQFKCWLYSVGSLP